MALPRISNEAEDYPGQDNERRRLDIIRHALDAADRIIMDGSDGSTEETNYLTGAVALAFAEKVNVSLHHELQRRDFTLRFRDEKLTRNSPPFDPEEFSYEFFNTMQTKYEGVLDVMAEYHAYVDFLPKQREGGGGPVTPLRLPFETWLKDAAEAADRITYKP